MKHGKYAKLLTKVERVGAIMRKNGVQYNEHDEEIAEAVLGLVYDDDVSKVKPLLAASLINTNRQLFELDRHIDQKGVVEQRTILDSGGNPHTFTAESPALRTKISVAQILGYTAQDAMLTKKSRAEGDRDEAVTKNLDALRELYGDPSKMAPPRAIETIVV